MTRKSRFLQITTFLYSGRWKKKKKKKKKKKNELHLLACSAALGPSGRGHRPKGDALTIFFLCCGALASALIVQILCWQKEEGVKALLRSVNLMENINNLVFYFHYQRVLFRPTFPKI